MKLLHPLKFDKFHCLLFYEGIIVWRLVGWELLSEEFIISRLLRMMNFIIFYFFTENSFTWTQPIKVTFFVYYIVQKCLAWGYFELGASRQMVNTCNRWCIECRFFKSQLKNEGELATKEPSSKMKNPQLRKQNKSRYRVCWVPTAAMQFTTVPKHRLLMHLRSTFSFKLM